MRLVIRPARIDLAGVTIRRRPQGLLTGYVSRMSLVKSEASLNCLLILQGWFLAEPSPGVVIRRVIVPGTLAIVFLKSCRFTD